MAEKNSVPYAFGKRYANEIPLGVVTGAPSAGFLRSQKVYKSHLSSLQRIIVFWLEKAADSLHI